MVGMPAASLADVADRVNAPEPMLVLTTAPRPWYNPGPGVAPLTARVEAGIFDTITESVFGRPDPDSWRPLLPTPLTQTRVADLGMIFWFVRSW